jgi:hypothetical protein
MEKWIIEFRYIAPCDYHTPIGYLPIQRTIREDENKDAAWEKFINSPYSGDRNCYRKISIERMEEHGGDESEG